MFKKFLAIIRSNRFLKQTIDEFASMLDKGETMYGSLMKIFHEGEDPEKYFDLIYKMDKEINAMEQDIRQRIVEHLSLSTPRDIPAGLILMSVVKDAERIGDYCKNMYEVAERMDRSQTYEPFWSRIVSMQREIFPMFQTVREAFLGSQKEKAEEQVKKMVRIAKESDAIIDELYEAGLPGNPSIAYALLARYCKRVSSHLGNIATAVIQPLPKLDFLDEP